MHLLPGDQQSPALLGPDLDHGIGLAWRKPENLRHGGRDLRKEAADLVPRQTVGVRHRIDGAGIIRSAGGNERAGVDGHDTRPVALAVPCHLDRRIAKHRRVDGQRKIEPGEIEFGHRCREQALGHVATPGISLRGISVGKDREGDRSRKDIARGLANQHPGIVEHQAGFLVSLALPRGLEPLLPVVEGERLAVGRHPGIVGGSQHSRRPERLIGAREGQGQ